MTTEQINKTFINALELKGYKFTTKRKLYTFIKNNYRCEDYEQLQQKTFYVKEVPFLLYNYDITAKGGYYKYL